MTVGIITNKEKDEGLSFTKDVRTFLLGKGVETILEAPSRLEGALFWIVLGGDGTMLRASHYAAPMGIPLLGINLGHIGFLTDAEKNDGLAAIGRVIDAVFKSPKQEIPFIENRFMLLTDNFSPGLDLQSRLALNDVFIGATCKLMNFDLYIDNNKADTIRADGIVVSTPTGSTAYNWAAGGPILYPDEEMMVITPICPHSLGPRSLVVSAGRKVCVYPSREAAVVIDGDKRGTVTATAGINISQAPFRAAIIKSQSANFYDVLRKKKIL